MTNDEALLAIQEAMDGVEWTPDTLDAIAKIMRNAGYSIRDMDDRDGVEDHLPLAEPEFDNDPGMAEGWFISRVYGARNGDRFRLERDDSAGIFETDVHAWAYVTSCAAAGSAYHQSALDFLKEHQPNEYQAIMEKVS